MQSNRQLSLITETLRQWLPRVLDRLRDRAPALRALEVMAPRRIPFRVSPFNFDDLLPRIAEAGLSLTSGRAAAVVGSHLNKLQAERTQNHPRLKVFLSMAEAEAWLDAAPAADTSTEPNQRR